MHALTLKEAAERLRVHINTIRIHVKAGQVPAFRIGRLTLTSYPTTNNLVSGWNN